MGLLTNKRVQNPVLRPPCEEPGWTEKAFRAGLRAEMGCAVPLRERLRPFGAQPRSPAAATASAGHVGQRSLSAARDTATDSSQTKRRWARRACSGAGEAAGLLVVGESWGWAQALKFQAST